MTDRFDLDGTLSTERLVLEPLLPAHAALLFPLLRSEELRFIDRPPQTLAALEAQYQRWERRTSPDGREIWLNWAAREVSGGAYVGWFQATADEGEISTLAYVVFPAFWRRGYGQEACRRIIRLLWENGVRSIRVNVHEKNLSSIALAEKLGFTCVKRSGSGEECEYLLLVENDEDGSINGARRVPSAR